LISEQQLQVRKSPEKDTYKKNELITLQVQRVEGAGFYVWRIDGYGQRVIETKGPELGLIFKEKTDLSKDPVEIGLAGAPPKLSFKIAVSAYDNHYYLRLLAEGDSELNVSCE
jgi:hypothetical protein